LDGFGLRGKSMAVRAAGAILQYLRENQKDSLKLLTSLAAYTLDDFMVLDAATRRNLELTETIRAGEVEGSLLSVLDHTVTPLGKRQIRQWVSKPLLNLEVIRSRQKCVGQLLENGMLRAELRAALHPLGDLNVLLPVIRQRWAAGAVVCAPRCAASGDQTMLENHRGT